jgi:prolyl oligopeptidase
MQYPVTATGDTVDTLHGVQVPDPYRWLEDLDSPETRSWLTSQNALTFSFLEKCKDREAIRKRMETLQNYDGFGVPVQKGGKLFYTRRAGLQNQPVLYVSDPSGANERALLDPNTLSPDGTTALSYWSPDSAGERLVVGLSDAGSDWRRLQVVEVATGATLTDDIRWVKFSGVAWAHDRSGFFYARFDEPDASEEYSDTNYFQKVYFHKLGAAQSQDQLVYHRPDDKEIGFGAMVSHDGRRLLLHLTRGTAPESEIVWAPIGQDGAVEGAFTALPGGFEAAHELIEASGHDLWLLTDREAPMQRVVRVNLQDPAPAQWVTVVPETRDRIESASLVAGHFVVARLRDARSAVETHAMAGGKVSEVELPTLGTAYGFTGELSDAQTYFAFESFAYPQTIFRYSFSEAKSEILWQPKVAFDAQDFVVDQVFYTSKDGTRVPMFLARHRNTPKSSDTPTVLYGYGGFDISVTPGFRPARVVWLEMGGLFAVANLRGGGEYGRRWHEAGMKHHKQNVFDDFIAAAEWLVDEGYTRKEKLAISGRSNGGLLVGAAMTQRPDLFGAALPGVGVLDMLRFHKFTIGWAWVPEYGSADDPAEFETLLAYSPLHNLAPGRVYPATLITTGDHDDRVVPGHSYKFAAALQKAQGGPNPVLIRVDVQAGHGAGKPTSKQIDEYTDEWAFLVLALGMNDGQLFAPR